MEKEHYLVTGGGGFLGSTIVRLLVERGEAVSTLSRQRYLRLESLGVIQHQGDISDPEAVSNACKDVDVVFHVAAKAGIWGEYEDFFNTNVRGTDNIIQACFDHGISRLIYTSSPSVVFDGNDMEGVSEIVPYPESYRAHYPLTKAMAEWRVLEAVRQGLSSIILRPHLIWGPEDNHLVPRIVERADQLKRIGKGENLVDTIYIDNAARAHVLAADRLKENPELSGRIYFLSQDDPIILWDMVDAILNAAGLSPVKESVPPSVAYIAGFFLEVIHSLFNKKTEPRMTRFLAEELSTSHWFNISAAKNDLGYTPEITTEEGLKRLKQWFDRKRNHEAGTSG